MLQQQTDLLATAHSFLRGIEALLAAERDRHHDARQERHVAHGDDRNHIARLKRRLVVRG